MSRFYTLFLIAAHLNLLGSGSSTELASQETPSLVKPYLDINSSWHDVTSLDTNLRKSLGTALAICIMARLGVTHPPAGAAARSSGTLGGISM